MQRKRYSPSEKSDAVRAVKDGATVRHVAQELGVHEGVLRRWVREQRSAETTGVGMSDDHEDKTEIARLKREIKRLRAERDFLATEKKGEGDHSISQSLILNATEQLLIEEGHASLSTRKVAKKVGVTPALIHYYFTTTDQLLLALLQRKRKRHDECIRSALNSPDPLRELWNFYSDKPRTALELEFMAMVTHRDTIKQQLLRDIGESRRAQVETLQKLFTAENKSAPASALCLTVLIAIVGRGLVTEELLGIDHGHDEIRHFIQNLIDGSADVPSATDVKPGKRAAARV